MGMRVLVTMDRALGEEPKDLAQGLALVLLSR